MSSEKGIILNASGWKSHGKYWKAPGHDYTDDRNDAHAYTRKEYNTLVATYGTDRVGSFEPLPKPAEQGYISHKNGGWWKGPDGGMTGNKLEAHLYTREEFDAIPEGTRHAGGLTFQPRPKRSERERKEKALGAIQPWQEYIYEGATTGRFGMEMPRAARAGRSKFPKGVLEAWGKCPKPFVYEIEVAPQRGEWRGVIIDEAVPVVKDWMAMEDKILKMLAGKNHQFDEMLRGHDPAKPKDKRLLLC